MHGDRFDTAQNDVLGDLDTEAVHAGDEHIGRGHLSHCLMAEHVELARVEILVDLAVAGCGTIFDVRRIVIGVLYHSTLLGQRERERRKNGRISRRFGYCVKTAKIVSNFKL